MEARSPLKELNRQNLNEPASNTMKPVESVRDDRTSINVDLVNKTDQENDTSGAKANKNQHIDSLTNPLKIDIGLESNLTLYEDGLLSDSDDYQSISPINKEDELLLNTPAPYRKRRSEDIYATPCALNQGDSGFEVSQTDVHKSVFTTPKIVESAPGDYLDTTEEYIVPRTPESSDTLKKEGSVLNVTYETGSNEKSDLNLSHKIDTPSVIESALCIAQEKIEPQEDIRPLNQTFEEPKPEKSALHITQEKIEPVLVEDQKLEKSVPLEQVQPKEDIRPLNQTFETPIVEEPKPEKSALNITQEKIEPVLVEDQKLEKSVPLEQVQLKEDIRPLNQTFEASMVEEPKPEKSALNITQEKIEPVLVEDQKLEKNVPLEQVQPKKDIRPLNQTFEAPIVEEPKPEKSALNITQEKIEPVLVEDQKLEKSIALEQVQPQEDIPFNQTFEAPIVEKPKLEKCVPIEQVQPKEDIRPLNQTLEAPLVEEPKPEKSALNITQEKIEPVLVEDHKLEKSVPLEQVQPQKDIPLNQTLEAPIVEEPKPEKSALNITQEKIEPVLVEDQELEKSVPLEQVQLREDIPLNQTFEAPIVKEPKLEKSLPIEQVQPKEDIRPLNQRFEAPIVEEPKPEKSALNITQEKIEPVLVEDQKLEKSVPIEKVQPQGVIKPLNQIFEAPIEAQAEPKLNQTFEAQKEEISPKKLNLTFEAQEEQIASNTTPLNQTFEAQKKEISPKKLDQDLNVLNQTFKTNSEERFNQTFEAPKEPKEETETALNETFESTKKTPEKIVPDSLISSIVSPPLPGNRIYKPNEPAEVPVKEIVSEQTNKVDDVTTPPVNLVDVKIKKMAEITSEQQREIADLKFQLQQVRASLDLEIRQKEEIVQRSQTERNEFKTEIKELNEMLREKSKIHENNIENGGSKDKELEEQVKEAKEKVLQVAHELKKKEAQSVKMFEDFEANMTSKIAELDKLNKLHHTTKTHLANLEFSFSDVHKKYESLKVVLEGYKTNETTLKQSIALSQNGLKKAEERYETLKLFAKSQIEKCNKDIHIQKKMYEDKQLQLTAINKRLEIKCKSLESSLEQKTNECQQLAALCDQLTGKNM